METSLKIKGHEENARRLAEKLAREKNLERADRIAFSLRVARAMLAVERSKQQLIVGP
jgi:hypothetical protein